MYLVLCVTGLVSLYVLRLVFRQASSRTPPPPGPKPLPIIGNVRDMPATDSPEWLHWLKHKELYGPISSVSVLGQRIIILNDARIAFELLEKRSAIYSDRPKLPFATLCGMGDTVLMQGYGKRLQTYRKYIHREMGSTINVARFDATHETEVRRFLVRLLDAPQNLAGHARGLAAGLVLKVLYGYNMDYTRTDPLLDYIEKALKRFIPALAPGRWLVDAFPFLRHIPAWFPGAGFRRFAQGLKHDLESLVELPFCFVKKQIKAGSAETSYVSSLLGDKANTITPGSKEETDIKWSAVSLYFGGSDTTVSTITSLFLAMVLNPDVQRRAQEEIDRVVGRDRLPGFADRNKLPYINAVVKESLRWHPVTPMGVAHSLMEDDIYDGYRIPKGSVIMPNTWAFCHDPTDYKDPMTFNPSRFLGDTPERDPSTLVFGFGRRICPGRILADSNIYLTIAMSLAAFNISKPVRDDGEEVDVQARFLPGITSHPAPFELSVKLRDPRYKDLVLSVQEEHPWETGDAEVVRGMIG
ncbi:cytochrome P450 [Aspergillus granulosus]|uniref:Cytochrome P450 n=1 Tax=Aspergillus granulosus TaxID=176169 RepID=A0ABR4HVH2_9EURO